MISGLESRLHIIIVCVVVLLVFGAKRVPEMGRSLGGGIREFKDGISGQTRAPSPVAGAAVENPEHRVGE